MFSNVVSTLALAISLVCLAQITVLQATLLHLPQPVAPAPTAPIADDSDSSPPPTPTVSEPAEHYKDELYRRVRSIALQGCNDLRVQGNLILNDYVLRNFPTEASFLQSNDWLVVAMDLQDAFPALSNKKKGDFIEHAIASLNANDQIIFLAHYCTVVRNHPQYFHIRPRVS